MKKSLDITPHPRIYQMLENIEFTPYQCLCELIDNSIDAFNEEEFIYNEEPEIRLDVPKERKNEIDPLCIMDNGNGMNEEQLNKSIKAGFSGNNSMDKMGLFGMGFNIATARLGQRTEIITYRKDDDYKLKVIIDINELNTSNTFNVPFEQIPKEADELGKHGTEIYIYKIKEGFLRKLRKKANISKQLGRTYGRILRNKKINLIYMGLPTTPFEHCVWDKTRKGKNNTPVRIEIDEYIDTKKFCVACFEWLTPKQISCASCNDNKNLIERERRVKGWIGLQRFFDEEKYGIDLIRNGRIIRTFDKSIFYWNADDLDIEDAEKEYPIDGSHGGRFVGELEIDFVQVDFQKKSFVKTSKDWNQVLRVIRGDGPIRPRIAKSRNFPINESSLAKLFNAFRGDDPGIENFVPRNPSNVKRGIYQSDSRIKELKYKFFENERDFQDDEKWYELLLKGEVAKNGHKNDIKEEKKKDDYDPNIGDDPFSEEEESTNNSSINTSQVLTGGKTQSEEHVNQVQFIEDKDLSGTYYIEQFVDKIFVDVQYAKNQSHAKGFHFISKGSHLTFKYWPDTKIFQETFLRPEDLLINELAYLLFTTADAKLEEYPLSVIERSLRKKYFPYLQPELDFLSDEINNLTKDIRIHFKNTIKSFDNYNPSDLSEKLKNTVLTRMNHGELMSAELMKEAIEKGQFMNFTELEELVEIFKIYPELLFDGEFFNKKFSYEENHKKFNNELIENALVIFEDIIWWKNNGSPNSSIVWKGRSRRVIGSLEIIRGWRT